MPKKVPIKRGLFVSDRVLFLPSYPLNQINVGIPFHATDTYTFSTDSFPETSISATHTHTHTHTRHTPPHTRTLTHVSFIDESSLDFMSITVTLPLEKYQNVVEFV